MSDNPNVRRVEFLKSAVAKKDWPPPDGLPEVAIAGRSNVGKSSLINRLVNRRQLARVSNTPGRTQLLNFFRVNDAFTLCDLPGYGFAKVPTAVKAGWAPMIEGYLGGRDALRVLMLLLDCRRAPGEWETGLVTYCSTRGLAMLPVVTKIDKLSKSQRFPMLTRISGDLGLPVEALCAFSAETGEGLLPLWNRLERMLRVAVPDAGEASSPPETPLA